MSDANLLAFGCAVTFIAVAGAYSYIRESWSAQEKPRERQVLRAEVDPQVQDVA